MKTYIRRANAGYVQLVGTLMALVALQYAGSSLNQPNASYNPFSALFVRSLIVFIFTAAQLWRDRSTTVLTSLAVPKGVLHLLRLSSVLFGLSITRSALEPYYNHVLSSFLGIFGIPKTRPSLPDSTLTTASLLSALEYLFVLSLAVFSTVHFSLTGVTIFLVFMVLLFTEARYANVTRNIPHEHVKVLLRFALVILSFIFFLLFGKKLDLRSPATLGLIADSCASCCSELLLDTVQKHYNTRIFLYINVILKVFSMLRACTRETSISIVQLGILAILVALFYIRSVREVKIKDKSGMGVYW